MKKYYCWRCETEIPMLDEKEWEKLNPFLNNYIDRIKHIRKNEKCDTNVAKQKAGKEALDLYFEITGYKEINFNALWHHRLSIYGDECPKCGHLFRTPTASFCANCGYKK